MEIDPAAAWNGLEEPWRVCLSLAWEAYGAGTIPVGAALVDGEGAVVAEGRNRVYEPAAPPGQLANSLLAHAEVNALLALDPERRYEDHVLYTALEPCLLCVGATVMATVGRIRYAGADPYGGGDGALTGRNAHTERVPLRLEGPREDAFGLLASALLPAFFVHRNPDGHVVRAFAERAPATLAVAERLLEAGAPELAARGAPDPMRSSRSGCISGAPSRSNWRNLTPARVLRELTTRKNVQLPFPPSVSTLTLRMLSGWPREAPDLHLCKCGGKGNPQ